MTDHTFVPCVGWKETISAGGERRPQKGRSESQRREENRIFVVPQKLVRDARARQGGTVPLQSINAILVHPEDAVPQRSRRPKTFLRDHLK